LPARRCEKDYFFGAGFAAPGFGASPITVFNGHADTMGHFAQVATIAIGHSVMALPPSL
jgi:hypothetical protein